MPSFNSIKGENRTEDNIYNEYSEPKKQSGLLSKVFLIMFASILLTVALSYGIGFLLTGLYDSGIDTALDVYIIAMFVSSIGILVMAFVLPFILRRGKHSILPAYLIYILFLSILSSSLFIFVDPQTLLLTLGATSLVFGIMGFLGFISKGKMTGIRLVIVGLLIGVLILSIVNLLMRSEDITWIISFSVLAAIMFITLCDVARIKEIIESGSANNNNLILYCSFMLFLDFINIFLRFLIYISKVSKR